MLSELETFLKTLGCHNADNKLYKEAFTHSSYRNEKKLDYDLERLEFMGDSVLSLLISDYLFAKYPGITQGELTLMRSLLVREETLAKISDEMQLPQYLFLGMGEEKNGGRKRMSLRADLLESFIGATYLLEGINFVKKLFLPLFKKQEEHIELDNLNDYKTRLQEFIAADNNRQIEYRLVESFGPSNAPTFIIDVFVDNIKMGTGKGFSKKKAELEAAKEALSKMVK